MENQSQIDLPLLIIIATMGVLCLVLFIILMVFLYQKRMLQAKTTLANTQQEHQKKLLESALEIAEKERQKIAVNLHDEVGVNLSILKMNFGQLKLTVSDNEKVNSIVSVSNGLIDNSMEIIRDIYSDIRPKTLLTLGLITAIKELCRGINHSGSAEVRFICKQEIQLQDKNLELQLHRLIKEVLNNTLRHAKPTFIEINIENKENRLLVSILHNGMGVTTEKIKEFAKNSKGLGLKSIFTRLEILNGHIDFSNENNTQAKVILYCPIV